MKKNKIYENLVWIIFMSIGTVFLVGSGLVYSFFVIPKEDRVECIATIMDIYEENDKYNISIMYDVDGVIYENTLNYYDSSYFVGRDVTIYYDRKDPSRISETDIFEVLYVFGGIGGVFLTASLFILFFIKRDKNLIIKLKETGYVVNAKYLNSKINKNYVVNNKHPYNVICEWDNSMDGKKHTFKSKNIWTDPEKIIKDKNIKTFKVYYNPKNLKQYYMDIDILEDNYNYFK